MTITVELLQEEALALLRNLERLKILKLLLPEKQPAGKTTRKSRFAGRISPATAKQLHQQLAQMREEWR
ncbi:MAG: hypothetical protein EPO28_00675 [Saprospiraceae bacterium]|nr:MAG: hypothetical protein EPO28_00675 [Saprospiraceae bacterium]